MASVLLLSMVSPPCPIARQGPPRPMAPSLGLLVLQHNNVAGGPAGKQRPDQLRGHCLVALWTLIPLKAVSERVWSAAVKVRGGRVTYPRSFSSRSARRRARLMRRAP